MEIPCNNRNENMKFILFISLSFLYFIACLFSFLFAEINSVILPFCQKIIGSIPSIINTADITKNKEASTTVLIISWSFSILTWWVLNIESKWKGFSPAGSKKLSSGIMIGAFLACWLFLFMFISFSPADFFTVDRRGEFLYSMLREHDYFIIFYGYILMILMASVLNAISGIPIYFLRSKKSKGE